MSFGLVFAPSRHRERGATRRRKQGRRFLGVELKPLVDAETAVKNLRRAETSCWRRSSLFPDPPAMGRRLPDKAWKAHSERSAAAIPSGGAATGRTPGERLDFESATALRGNASS